MGFQEVTKFLVLPGWHQPGPVSGVMISKKSWDKLSDRVKFMFKEAAMATMMWSWTYFEYSSGEYNRKFKEKGMQYSILDKPTLDKIQELANKYMIEDAEANLITQRLLFHRRSTLWTMRSGERFRSPSFGPPKMDEMY
jgi:TRAP-type mannitol/chloroaromatic compound transport system substrate-binding protein